MEIKPSQIREWAEAVVKGLDAAIAEAVAREREACLEIVHAEPRLSDEIHQALTEAIRARATSES